MNYGFIILMVLFVGTYAIPKPEDYVSRYCSNPVCDEGHQPTLCERKGFCAPEPNCGYVAPTDEFRQLCLDFHNKMRNKIALGEEKRGGNSQASNMNALIYDLEIEFITQCYANQCIYEHDKCRGTTKYPQMGQNIAKSTYIEVNLTMDYALRMLTRWYETEIEKANAEVLDEFHGGGGFGHYTQVIWAEAEAIGCTRNYYTEPNGKYTLLIFCDYSTGNVLGEKVYQRGAPCSQCPKDKVCSRLFPGLCGEPRIRRGKETFYYYSPNETDPVHKSHAILSSSTIRPLIFVPMLLIIAK